MKRRLAVLMFILFLLFAAGEAAAQCSICTKSAQQLGDKAGKGLNLSIIYLAFVPLLIILIIGYRWYKSERNN